MTGSLCTGGSKGRRAGLGLEIGERQHFRRRRVGARLAMLDVMWDDGVSSGYQTTSGETMVGAAAGVEGPHRSPKADR